MLRRSEPARARLPAAVLFLLPLLLSFGCAPRNLTVEETGPSAHTLLVNRRGDYVPIVAEVSSSSEVSPPGPVPAMPPGAPTDEAGENCESDPLNRHVDFVLANLRHWSEETSRRRLLLFIPGARESLQEGWERARSQSELLRREGYYPVFLGWESTLFDCYATGNAEQPGGESGDLGWAAPPINLLTDSVKAMVGAPEWLALLGSHEFQSVFSPDSADLSSCAQREEELCLEQGAGPTNTLDEQILWLVTVPARLVSAPFVYTTGSRTWSSLRDRTNLLFRKSERAGNQPFTSCERHDEEQHRGSGVAAVFFEKLSRHLESEARDGRPYEVVLVGYSAGTIVLNRALSTFPELEATSVVYIAAAASVRETMESVVPYLRAHPSAHFYSLSLHPRLEDRQASMGGLVPTGSVLTWIDEVFDPQTSYLDRTLGRWTNARRSLDDWPQEPELRKRIHFKIFKPSQQNGPRKHEDFDDEAYWRPSFWWK